MNYNDKEIKKIAKYFQLKGYEVRPNKTGNIITFQRKNETEVYNITKYKKELSSEPNTFYILSHYILNDKYKGMLKRSDVMEKLEFNFAIKEFDNLKRKLSNTCR